MNRYAAVDIGGTTIKFGVLEESGVFLEKRTCPTPPGEQILPAVLALVEDALERWPLRGVAVSSTGVVDCETGTIVYAGPTVPHYAGTNFKQAVEAKFGLPCQVENDVNCAGLAEYLSGAGKGSRCLVCLTVGTGVGGCAILHGKVLHGASGSAMEVGYLPVAGRDLQEWASTSALCRQVAQSKGEPLERWDGKRVLEAAEKGDPVCVQAVDELCRRLGQGIGAVAYVLNPDRVVLGGGIMAHSAALLPKIFQAVKETLRPVAYEALTLCGAAYGNDAGMVRALNHFLEWQNK